MMTCHEHVNVQLLCDLYSSTNSNKAISQPKSFGVPWILLILDTAKPVSKLLSFIYLLMFRLRTSIIHNSNVKVEM